MANNVLVPRKLYEYHTGNDDRHGRVLECIRVFPKESNTVRLRSTITGWTFTAHNITVYPDDSIDWEYSSDHCYTDFNDEGCLIRRY